MTPVEYKRNFLQRLLGIPATGMPSDPRCWGYEDGTIVVDLDRAPELGGPGGGVRFEGERLPMRVLLIHGDDGRFHAFRNACGHGGRRLDPMPGTHHLRCCSVGQSTFDYAGNVVSGPSTKSLTVCPVERRGQRLLVTVASMEKNAEESRLRQPAAELNSV